MGIGLLVMVIALSLGLVYISVLLNKWNNNFYNSLEAKDLPAFKDLLWTFAKLATVYIVIAVYKNYLMQMLQIKWREHLTKDLLSRWIGHNAFYKMQVQPGSEASHADNPDQRIANDIGLFVDQTLGLSIGFIRSTVSLVSFVTILWGLSGLFNINTVTSLVGLNVNYNINGYLVYVAILYAAIGSGIMYYIGRPLIKLNVNQQMYEANFRFGLARMKDSAESIASYNGGEVEKNILMRKFNDVVGNWWAIMRRQKKMTWFEAGYSQIADIFPILVVAPRYFSGAIQLGGLMQTASAFGKVHEALSFFISAFSAIADWRSAVLRLNEFMDKIEASSATSLTGASAEASNIQLDNIQIQLPNGDIIVKDVNLEIEAGHKVAISGESGSGKTTLLRVLSGIWPHYSGDVLLPENVLFLSQKPYLPLGGLKECLAYPKEVSTYTDMEYSEVLAKTGLTKLIPLLNTTEDNLHNRLSLGEQQRIAVSRALLHKPSILIMDESLSSIDEDYAIALQSKVFEELKSCTIISIAHMKSLKQGFDVMYKLKDGVVHLEHQPAV